MMLKNANMNMITTIILGLIVVVLVVSMNSSLFGKTNDSVEDTFSLSNILASNDAASTGGASQTEVTSSSTTSGGMG